MIRAYKGSDLPEIKKWVLNHHTVDLPDDMLVEDGSFIYLIDNVRALCLTILLTQSKQMAYIFGFLKNPAFKEFSLEKYGQELWDHCTNYAKDRGYKRVICFSNEPKLKEKYMRFGMTKSLDGLSSFVKEL